MTVKLFDSIRVALAYIVWLVFSPMATAGDFVYRDDTHAWQVSLPAEWVPLEQPVLHQINDLVKQRNLPTAVHYSAGFSLDPAGQVTYPYILIQWFEADLGKSSWDDFESAFNGVSFERTLEDSTKNLNDLMSRSKAGQTLVDRANGRVMVGFEFEVAEIGSIRSRSVGAVAKNGVAYLHYYDRASAFDNSVHQFARIADSLAIDPASRFTPTSSSSRVGTAAINGAIAGGIAAVIVVILLSIRRKKAMPPPVSTQV